MPDGNDSGATRFTRWNTGFRTDNPYVVVRPADQGAYPWTWTIVTTGATTDGTALPALHRRSESRRLTQRSCP